MLDFSSVTEKIKATYSTMSHNDKLLAQYVIEHHREMAFASAARVGKAVKVSPATVVRFANHLGLSGYSELQELARRAIRQEINTVSELERIPSKSSARSLFHDAISADIRNLEQVSESISDDTFSKAVKVLSSARTIHVVGLRSLYGLAHHFTFLLTEIGRSARILQPGIGNIAEQLIDISPEDVCVALSFRRYTRETVSLFAQAQEQGAKTIALTDTELSPLNQHASIALIVPVNSPAFFESRIGALSVISALTLAIGNETREVTLESLRRREAAWKKYHAYESPTPRSRYDDALEVFASAENKAGVKRPSSTRRNRKKISKS
jgi:DNA-binding MurR/RpiR family transcriptional regulator